MSNYDAKQIGEFLAYGTAVTYAFFKISQNIFKLLKDFFGKKSDEFKGQGVTVNIGSHNQNGQYDPNISPVDAALFHVLLEQAQLLYLIHNMRSDILKEQMVFFNKKSKSIKLVLINIMISLLREVGIDEDNYCTYFSNFENFLDLIELRVATTFRGMCKNNHFSEYSSLSYSDLIKTNISLIEGEIDELFRSRYPQKAFIKNFDKIRATRTINRHALVECFEEARKITIERETEMQKIKETFEEKISKITRQTYKFHNGD